MRVFFILSALATSLGMCDFSTVRGFSVILQYLPVIVVVDFSFHFQKLGTCLLFAFQWIWASATTLMGPTAECVYLSVITATAATAATTATAATAADQITRRGPCRTFVFLFLSVASKHKT